MGAGSSAVVSPKTSIAFTLNGHSVQVDGASPQLTLNQWLRAQPGLKGTKRMCSEGGCGCCVVTAVIPDAANKSTRIVAINSCLCPLYSIDGWAIITVEGIGNSQTGFHPIQERVAAHNGSQCGYCTPGFVMSMYSLLKAKPKPSPQQVEDNFDGNICRCTGYRPILDAMKSFAAGAESIDIEDLDKKACCKSTGQCSARRLCPGRQATAGDALWYSPESLEELAAVYRAATHSSQSLRLVCGDTGRGVFKDEPDYDVYVDLKHIPELYNIQISSTAMTVGSCVTLSELIAELRLHQDMSASFPHLADHLSKIASTPVRNVGSWAGNLMLTHNNDNFPSDVFTVMAAVGAVVNLAFFDSTASVSKSLWEFLQLPLNNGLIVSLVIPLTTPKTVFRSYKIMPRAENAHAYVNAAFSAEVDTGTIKTTPTLVFGGLGTHAVSAPVTASYLTGRSLSDIDTLRGALAALDKELVPNSPPAAASVEYRKSLAISLFYKFYLACVPGSLSPAVKSAAAPYIRPISSGQQGYSTNPSEYPVTQPMPKLTAPLQASGEAQYVSDIPSIPGELAAAFVLSTQANAKVTAINGERAKGLPGFVALLTAADIPGKNTFVSPNLTTMNEELFVEVNGVSQYAGQAVGIVIADTQEQADKIAQAVTVDYQSLGKPLLTLEDAIRSDSYFSAPGREVTTMGDPDTAIKNSEHVITGQISCGTQYHFTMETQTAVVVPLEGSYHVHSSTQWMDNVQAAVANALGVGASCVDVSVKRVGGAYGSKLTRSNLIAAACAVGAHVTGRPVRMHMDIDSNMKMVGKRFPYLATYQLGSAKDGTLNGIKVTVYTDCGITPNDNYLSVCADHIDNAYHCSNWEIVTRACKTNNAANTYCRSPGTLPGIFIMESIIDHLGRSLGLEIEALKRANLYKQGQVTPRGYTLTHCNVASLWDQLYKSAGVESRKTQVAAYNESNRWRKRGLAMMPLRFGISWNAQAFTVLVNVYAEDGTVAVVHGGVEIGQGINVKVAQVVAKELGVPIDRVKVKTSSNLTSPNGAGTGGSVGSELNCMGALNCCKILNGRIQPIRAKNPDIPWPELVQKCYGEGIDLSAKFYVFEDTESLYVYNAFGATVSEVEVDILTGQTQVLRVDMLYDCGESINPDVDIGQAEGAFVMGLGYWLHEKCLYEEDSGRLLTHNTWEYKPPSSKDIPIDFRVELLKNAPNPLGVLGSKAVGEPPQCMSCSVLFATKRAIESARADAGNKDFFPLVGPATVEAIQTACLVNPSQFTF